MGTIPNFQQSIILERIFPLYVKKKKKIASKFRKKNFKKFENIP